MPFSFKIYNQGLIWRVARRYLFVKKSTNIINLITGIAVFGLAVGAAALVLILSVFNGFEEVIDSLYSSFNPDIKITPTQGKSFTIADGMMEKLQKIPGVAFVSQSLEEVAFFEYDGKQDFGTLKGVDGAFIKVTALDSTVREGKFQLRDGQIDMAVVSMEMRNQLAINIDDFISPLVVYMPKRKEVGALDQQFRRGIVYPSGTFVVQQEYNGQYVITSLEFARALLNMPDAVSSLEVKLKEGVNPATVVQDISEVLGPKFSIKDRYHQQEAFMKLMHLEKWMSFAIVSLMLLMVAFNMIGALWMIVLEKKKDISILKSMGARDNTIRNIFLVEGFLLTGLGVGLGFVLALMIYFLQKQFGIVSMPGTFAVDSYPVSIRLVDFVVVCITVLFIGGLASIPPALRARQIPTVIREE
jgi:lipoprotein-releasing system permease protein